MTAYRHHVVEALRAVVIRSRHRFTWLGDSSPSLPGGLASALPASAARALLVSRIRARLYRSFYCLGGVGTVEEGLPHAGRSDPDLVAALSGANTGAGSWEAGWRVAGGRDDELLISRDGLCVRARQSECRSRRGRPVIGTEVAVALPRELRAFSPGFFTALGDVYFEPELDDLVARVYFNVSSAGAPALVGEATAALNHARVPFRLKVLDHPGRFGRCDAAVLYLHAADLRRRRRLIQGVVDACAAHLQPRTPVFTKPLAPGVGLGEERGAAVESFGMRRCRVLAEGVVKAHEQRNRDLDGRLVVVERHFRDAGIDLDVPYLERESVDDYTLGGQAPRPSPAVLDMAMRGGLESFSSSRGQASKTR